MSEKPDLSIYEEGSTHHTQQLAAEVFKQRLRKDARRVIEEQDRDRNFGSVEGLEPALVYAPLPEEPPELIPGLIPQSGTAAIVGETEAGKSLLACEIASSLLTGQPLWGSIEPTKRLNKVLYVLGEHTVRTIQGLFHRTKLPHEGNFYLIGPEHLHPYKALVIGGVVQQASMDRLMKWSEGAEFIVFDPLAGFIQGLTSEQDNTSMRTLIDAMSYIAERQAAACLILSHMGKPKLDDSGSEVRRTSYAMRGASSQEDALTHVFYLRKAISVKQQQGPELYDLAVRKFKGNPSSSVFRLQRDSETKRNTLLVAKSAKGYPTMEERLELAAKVQRVRENNPKYALSTAIKVVADSEGFAPETVQRWLAGQV